ILELVSLQSSASRGVRQCFQVEERSGGAGAEITEVTCRNAQGEDALTDPVEVDADLRRACVGTWLGRQRNGGWRRIRVVAGFRQQWRWLVCRQHGEVDGAASGTVERAHLEPARARAIIRAREEIEVLASCVERRRYRVRHRIGDLMRLPFPE